MCDAGGRREGEERVGATLYLMLNIREVKRRVACSGGMFGLIEKGDGEEDSMHGGEENV